MEEGLSPRVWGNPILTGHAFIFPGSIPTCVGQPPGNEPSASMAEVYPHVCGATGARNRVDVDVKGLSPRVWGNRPDVDPEELRNRSIPTCVGQP